MDTELVFSLYMDPEKPVENLPFTYLRCCPLSPLSGSLLLFTTKRPGACSPHPCSISHCFLPSNPLPHTCTVIIISCVLNTMVSS